MLELIISILLSLGIHFTDPSEGLKNSPDAVIKVQQDPHFESLGGQAELSHYLGSGGDGTTPKPPEDIVVTTGVDPQHVN